MLLRRATALVAGATLPLATAIALAPAATAQTAPEPPVTETVEVTYACNANNALNIGGANPWTNTVTASYPETVAPGAFFDVTIQAGEMAPSQSRTGRVTYDIQLPANTTNLGHTVGNDMSGLSGNAQADRVDANTKVNSGSGEVLRLWGGTSARYGTSTGNSTNSGLQNSNSEAFQLPTVTFTMRAPVTPGEEIVFGLPGAGAASAATAATTQFQYVRGTSTRNGTQVECAASASAAALTRTTVADVAPNILDSTTRIIGGDQTADSSIPVELQAQVAAPFATTGELSQGTVTFVDQATNLVVGTANPNAQGIATIQHQFPRIPDGDADQRRTVVATYSGITGNIASSEDTINLTLTEKPTVFWNTDFTVRANVGQLDDDSLPVDVTATFSRPGQDFPEGTVVQLYRDALPIGEPVAMPTSGTSITFPTDEIPRTDRTGTHNYTVELETIYLDYNEWRGSTQNPGVVVVAGTDGVIDGPVPGTGSVDLGSLSNSATSSLSGSLGYDIAPLSSPAVTGLLSSAS